MHGLLQSLPPTLQQDTSNLCLHQRLLDTHRQVFFLLSPGAQGSAPDHCQPVLPQETFKYSSVSVSVGFLWCEQGLFEPSECLWWEWGLILNVIPPLQSCWIFSFALECGVSPHIPSSAYNLTGISLTLDMGYLFMGAPQEVKNYNFIYPKISSFSFHRQLVSM